MLLYSYLKGSDYNIICLNWDKLATIENYLGAAINSNTVGDFVGEKLVADIFIATVRDFSNYFYRYLFSYLFSLNSLDNYTAKFMLLVIA